MIRAFLVPIGFGRLYAFVGDGVACGASVPAFVLVQIKKRSVNS